MMTEGLAPAYTRKANMTPEQLEAHKEATRKYKREYARANQKKRWARMKERMATDPEYLAHYRKKSVEASARRRAKGYKWEASDESKEKMKQRAREYRAKKYREWRLANPIEPKVKEPKSEKPVIKTDYKRKPGRLLASMGWNGF